MLIGALAPAMATGVDRTTMYDSWSNGLAATVQPASWAGVIGVAAAFFAAATLLMTLFKVPLAHAVRGDGWNGRGLARDIFLGWLRFLGLVGLVVVAFAVVGLPLMLGTAAVLLAGVNLLPLVSLAVFILGTMAALYAYFVLDAMFIYRVGPIQAARMSYAVARINLGQTWRFAGASLLIASGLLQIWHVIVENPPGVIIALVTNAVVGTGLSIASMMFFHDRARLPRSVPAMNTFSTRRGFPPRSS
jgi:hypothetical protein